MNQENFNTKLLDLQIPNFRNKHNQQRDLFILNAWLCEGKDMTEIGNNNQSLETSIANLDVHRSTISRSIKRLCEYFEVEDKFQLVNLFLEYAPEFVDRIRFDEYKNSEQQHLLDRIGKKKLYEESPNNLKVDNKKGKVIPQFPENMTSEMRVIVPEEMGSAKEPVANISSATKTIIDDRLSNGFVGREFVFEAFQKFIDEYSRGYFTIVAEPGMGKSTIAAQYVRVRSVDVDCVCFFINYRGDNTEETCIIDICRQLRELYELADNLQGLSIGMKLADYLQEISDYKLRNRKLVIVIDALDELEKSNGSSNICFLPSSLPTNIYFLLTRRPFEESEEKLFVSSNCQKQNFQMWKTEYMEANNNDIKKYIQTQFNNEKLAVKLQNWMDNRSVSQENFVETLTERSSGNFMYIRYVIPAIADGIYTDANLSELPNTLRGHYRNHVDRMYRIQTSISVSKTDRKRIIAVFLESRDIKVSLSSIANLLELDLDEVVTPITIHFVPFFDPRDLYTRDLSERLEGSISDELLIEELDNLNLSRTDIENRYRFYHKDFVDFLKKEEIEKEIQAEINRKIRQRTSSKIISKLKKS